MRGLREGILMSERRWFRRGRKRGPGMLIGPLLLVSLFALLGASGPVAAGPIPPPYGYQCVQGSAVSTVQLWTPIVMTNSPYLGTSTGSSTTTVDGSFSFTSGPLTLTSTTSVSNTATVTSSNGAANGLFELDTWTIYQAVNQSHVLPAVPCRQPYVAKITTVGNQYTGALNLVPSGSTNDNYERTSISYNGYNSISFQNGYTENDGTVYTCGAGDWDWTVSQTTSTTISVSISVTISGGTWITTSGTFGITVASGSGSQNTFNYHIPGNSGTYYYTRLNGGGAGPINGALAWRQVPCGVADTFETTGLWSSVVSGGSSFIAAALTGYSTARSMSPTHSVTIGFTGGGGGTDYGSAANYRDFTTSQVNRITIAFDATAYSHDKTTWDSMYAGLRIRLYNSAGTNFATYEYWFASWYQANNYKTPPSNAISIYGWPTMNKWLVLDRNPTADWGINWSGCTRVRVETFVSAAGTVGDSFQMYFDDFSMA